MNEPGAPLRGRIMSLLQAGVPLSLLADLVAPPNSVELFRREPAKRIRPA